MPTLLKPNWLPYLTKPLFGEKCNGCGLCCQTALCPGAQQIFGGEKVRKCPALEYADGRTYCGIIRNPTKYLPHMKPENAAELSTLFGIALGIGKGCSMDDPDIITIEVYEEDRTDQLPKVS